MAKCTLFNGEEDKTDMVKVNFDKESNTVSIKLPEGASFIEDSFAAFSSYPNPEPYTAIFQFIRYN